MLKKSIWMILLFIAVFLTVNVYYNHKINASFGLTVLQTRDQASEGSKFVFGSYNGKDIIFEAIKNNVDGGTLAMTSGSVRRTTLCKGPCIGTTVAYTDTTLYETETAMNQSLNAAGKKAVKRDIFNPSVTEIFSNGQVGAGFNGTFQLNVHYLKDQNITAYDCNTYQQHTCDTGLPCEVTCTWDNVWLKQSSYIIPSVLGSDYAPLYSGIYPSFNTWNYYDNKSGSNVYFSYAIRPAVILDPTKIAFALETGLQDHILHAIDTKSTAILKLRVIDDTISVPSFSSKTQSYEKGDTIKIDYANAVSGKSVSALLFDKNNHLVYYQNFDTVSTTGQIQINTNQFQIGDEFTIRLVNEIHTGDDQPNSVSDLSTASYNIKIVNPHEIVYTKTPQAGSSQGDYEYLKNVNRGDVIGTIALQPVGATPIAYTLITNGDDTYKNFEIDGLDSQQSSSATILNVKIKQDAQDLVHDSLKAGSYGFCILTTDVNGYPSTQINGKTKVCTSFNVEKTNLSVTFNDPNQTKKTMTDAGTSWSETAVVTPTQGSKVTYTKVSGDISMLDVDSDTGAITYKGNNLFGKVVIRATADDDPSTGSDNYNPSFVEKEIVIYREVDGNLTPDPASSDTTVPTFAASDANVKTGGMIGKIQGTLGTPDTIGGSVTTYSYAIKPGGDGSMFQVNTSNGTIKSNANLGVGTYNFIIIVNDQWSSKEIPVTVNVGMAPAENLKFYQSPTSNTIITTKSATLTDTGVSVYATVKGSSNTNPVTYRIKDGSTNVITVHPNSGAITINGVGSVVIVAEKTGNSGQANAITELTFTVTAGSQSFIYTDSSGNELPKSGNDYDDYSEVYGQGKTFQLYTTGNPPGTIVTYALKSSSPTDVLSVDSNGLVSIYNASLNTQIGQVIVEATSHDTNGNYTDKTIELPINIKKANQAISFSGVTSAQNGRGTVSPVIIEQDISSNDGGVTVNDTNYYISVNPSASGIAWTNNGIDIEYDYSGTTAIEIPLEVTKAGNRNYNSVTATGKMKILSPSESTLSINQPGRIYYGDHFTLRSLQDDSLSSNVQYSFTVDNTIFVSNPTVNGNMADFDALKCSNGTKINITVTRTADGEVTLSKKITIEVLPKDINVIIDDKTKQKGDPNPPLTYQDFTSQLISWNDVLDVVDLNDVKLSTTATTNSKSGSYPITGNPREMNTTYPNYNFIFKEGKLMIDSDIDKDVDGDGKPDFNDPDGDDCPDLNIKWKDDSGNWIVINGDRDYDGIPDLNIDSDGDGKADLNIDTDNDGKPDINLVILKKSDWKPTKCVTVSSTVKEEYCTGTKVKPQINVDTDNDNIPDINIDTNGDMKADLNIAKPGSTKPTINLLPMHSIWKPDKDYKKDSFLYDSIGEHKPLLNIDTDGDGRPDINLDLDEDGEADLNIDVDGDYIPDVNIDSKGDGKADVNIDLDGDGTPDENIIEITEWKPNKDGNKDGFLFDTMEIKQKTELEDNGVKVEKSDGTPFLPNFALKVEDVTDTKKEEITNQIKDMVKDQEIKKVYDVKLFRDDVEIQPDGTLKIKIPHDNIKNPILIRKNADGIYERIECQIEGEYLTYETDELGIVSIIGDKEFETSVKGTYTPNVGGAITGDETNKCLNFIFIFISVTILMILNRNKQKDLHERNSK